RSISERETVTAEIAHAAAPKRMPSPADLVETGLMEPETAQPAGLRPFLHDLSGQRLGPYELLHRAGKGGMGEVYPARRHDQEFRKQVAIKLIKPEMVSEEVVLRFRHERQVLASLDHPNIAHLLDGGTEMGMPYLVMEYVEGTRIDEY